MSYTFRPSYLLWTLGAILIVLNVATTVLNAYNRKQLKLNLRSYSFEDNDYPAYFPVTLPAASLTPEDSVHYHIWDNGTARELEALFPPGGGFLYLGPDKRPFGVSMYHQMHCLVVIQNALMKDMGGTGHVHHCFNYLRQMILCDASPVLEPVVGDENLRNVNSHMPRTCKDWEAVRNLIQRNHEEVIDRGEVWW